VKYSPPVIRVRCTGTHGISPKLLDLVLIIVCVLGLFPIVSALRMSGRIPSNFRISEYVLPVIVNGSPSPGRATACKDLSAGIDSLQAEFSVSYLSPHSEKDLTSMHFLIEVENDRELLAETTALAARIHNMIKDYFELSLSDQQNAEMRKVLLRSTLDSQLGDLSAAVRRDCGITAASF